TDGSQFPSAVLSDTVNSTGSIITIGIYISGLFNSERIVYDNSWGRKSLLDFLKQYRIYVE
ncbi:MAG TPA: hypothetical protein VFM18_21235, partial [Methanosarcina sp.]|nr:hypothetical protein [Methanosarcina sp.]